MYFSNISWYILLQVTEFDRSLFSYPFVGIESASTAVTVTCEKGEATMRKHVSVQLPLSDAEEDKDSELVVVRYSDTEVQVRVDIR